jgi:hypothetical protein
MDITNVLEELRRELSYLDAAILTLERLQAKSVRRGRPPKLLKELQQSRKGGTRRSGLPGRSYAQRPR